MKFIGLDITGKKFGRLTAMRRDGRIGHYTAWLFRCDCGNDARINIYSILRGFTRSCGCYRRSRFNLIRKKDGSLRHGCSVGGTKTPEFTAFINAKQRCTNPKFPYYKNYGGRGIEFRFSCFEDFLAEVGLRPDPTLTLDRIDNNGHYEPGNLRWTTRKEQTRNQRPRRKRGKEYPIAA